ncbi:MAG: sialidase family protein [Flavobacteriales bacterium]
MCSDPDKAGWSSDRLLDRIVCQYSKNNGSTWSKGGGIGLNGSKDQDKEWACVSNDGKMIYSTWTQFDKYASTQEGDSTLILFSFSNKKAKKWSDPVRISAIAGDCIDDDQTVEGAVPTTGPNGEIYVSWALGNSILFDKSLDGGKTWLANDIEVSAIEGGWAHDIPGINRANGMPVTSCDRSGGVHNGRIYINWADQRNGKDDTDIWLVYSDDQGETWSEAIRVNDDPPGKQQFFTWMDLDQSTGFIYIVFYDRRAHNNNQTDVYLASSQNGGTDFTNEIISKSPFTPNESLFFGDYNNISAVNGVIRPIWTRCEGMKLSVWTALINR